MKRSKNRFQTLTLTRTGLLGALALAISAVELLIPPLPFMPPGAKPGLSNIVVLAAASGLGVGPAIAIAVIKALFAGLTRGVTAMLLSFAGGVCSAAVMALALKAGCFGAVGLGVAGALTHNLAQLGVAAWLFGAGFVSYLPWMLSFAVLTGVLTGLLYGAARPYLARLFLHKEHAP